MPARAGNVPKRRKVRERLRAALEETVADLPVKARPREFGEYYDLCEHCSGKGRSVGDHPSKPAQCGYCSSRGWVLSHESLAGKVGKEMVDWLLPRSDRWGRLSPDCEDVRFVVYLAQQQKRIDDLEAMLRIIQEELRPVRDFGARLVVRTLDAFLDEKGS